jgi:hypothetical protein
MNVDTDRGYATVHTDDVAHNYADSKAPREFHRPTDALGDQLAATLTRIPAHSDCQQGAGHHHGEIKERYLVTRGTLTMRFGDAIETVRAPAAARAARTATTTARTERPRFLLKAATHRKHGSGRTLHRRDHHARLPSDRTGRADAANDGGRTAGRAFDLVGVGSGHPPHSQDDKVISCVAMLDTRPRLPCCAQDDQQLRQDGW